MGSPNQSSPERPGGPVVPTPAAVIEPTPRAPSHQEKPAWFVQALAVPFEERFVNVAGCRIHYLRWGVPARPGLLFIHGGFAHAHWWDFIAPLFAEEFCVVALDLSGMGDSEFRNKYTGEVFAQEAIEVCADAGFVTPPILVGHSFGGYVALKAGALHGRELGGIVVVDFPVRPFKVQLEHEANRPLVRPKEVYPRLEAALDRFRLIPSQPCENDYILDHIAQRSVSQVAGGWSWKFDDQIFREFELGNIPEELARVTCNLAVVYGEKSALFPPEIISYMADLLRGKAPFLCMPGVHHHLFLEQPLAFVEALRPLLNDWKSGQVSRQTSNQPYPQ